MAEVNEEVQVVEVQVGDQFEAQSQALTQFEAQVAYILEILVSAAVGEVSRVVDANAGGNAEAEPVDQKVFHLSLVMAALAQDAVEKLCQLFHESKVTEVEELRRRLKQTESDLRLALENREGPRENKRGPQAGPQNNQASKEPQRRRVVVICDSALKRMPFFRLWSKSRKSGVRRVTVQDDQQQQQEEDDEAAERPLKTVEDGPRESRPEQINGQIQEQDDHHEPEEPAKETVDETVDEAEEDEPEDKREEQPEDEQDEAAVGPVDSQLDFLHRQTAYISRLVKRVRTVAEDKSVRRRKRARLGPAEASVSCSVCDKGFRSQKLLDVHTLLHTGERPHLCDVCGKSFMLRGSLLTHQRTHSDVRSFTCDTCGKSFHLKTHLRRHQTVHTQHKPYKCQYCGKAFRNTGNLKRHVFIHTGEKPYTCDYCGRSFIQNVTLQAHRLTHTGQKPFKCHCGKAYTQKNTLAQHQLTHDSAESWDKPVSCVACGEAVSRDDINQHLDTAHQTPLACVRCERPILSAAELCDHQREHTGKRPFTCTVCNKSFQSNSYLKIHLNNHSKDSEGRPYHCTICGRSFAHQATLTYHQNVHSGEKPYSCQTCGKTFSNPGNVYRHQLIHTGEKPYSCTVCNRSFNQSCSLKAHLRTHTGHKPYMCDNCGRSFSDRRNLKEHKCRA